MTLVGAFAGGAIASRIGVMRTLFLGGLLSAATNLLFSALALRGHDTAFLVLTVSADNFAGGLASAAFGVDQCSLQRHTVRAIFVRDADFAQVSGGLFRCGGAVGRLRNFLYGNRCHWRAGFDFGGVGWRCSQKENAARGGVRNRSRLRLTTLFCEGRFLRGSFLDVILAGDFRNFLHAGFDVFQSFV